MSSKLSLALSEFSKGRWAAEPSDEPPLHPTELNLVTRVRSGLGKLALLIHPNYRNERRMQRKAAIRFMILVARPNHRAK
jgi:hypothetical protein